MKRIYLCLLLLSFYYKRTKEREGNERGLKYKKQKKETLFEFFQSLQRIYLSSLFQ